MYHFKFVISLKQSRGEWFFDGCALLLFFLPEWT